MALTIRNFVFTFLATASAFALFLSQKESLQVEAKTLTRNKLLMISFDGFRWDYPKLFQTPNLDYFAKTGVHAPSGIRTAFVTKTLTTHFSIATGLHAESHGIVDSNMFDPVLNKTFKGSNESIWWDNGGEPLWVTAKRNGLRSGVFYWPGSDVRIKGMFADFYQPYHIKVNYNKRAEAVVNWLAKDQVDLAMMYFNEPDHAGHQYGAASNQVGQMVQRVDSVLGYIIKMLTQRNLMDNINILVVSDHGMANITTEDDHMIVLKDYIHMKNEVLASSGMGPVATILPKPGKEEVVYRKLRNAHPNMRVYWKEEVPRRLRYSNNRRILPIVLIADVGLVYPEEGGLGVSGSNLKGTAPQKLTLRINRKDDTLIGNHGYDNMEWSMNPIFYARGPDFKVNYKTGLFDSVDIYPLVCHLLKIPPAPNNGSLGNVAHLLKNPPTYGVSHEDRAEDPRVILDSEEGYLYKSLLDERDNILDASVSRRRLAFPIAEEEEDEQVMRQEPVYDADEVGEVFQSS